MAERVDRTNATASSTPASSTPASSTPAPVTPEHMIGHVLRPEEFLARADYQSAQPDPRLRRWIERYWSVTWDLEPGQSHIVTTIDDPSIHLTREWGGIRRDGTDSSSCASTDGAGTWITGPVTRGRFDVTQYGKGGVVGVKFCVGGTTAFTRADLPLLRDSTIPAAEWFGSDLPPADLPPSATGAAAALDRWLLAREPEEDPGHATFRALLALLADPAVTGTGMLEQRSGLSARGLQRMFYRFAGVGPKRMLLRARVMDAVAAIDSNDPRTTGDLAHDLGWFDQSHFVRDFRTITGQTPARYAARTPEKAQGPETLGS